MDALPKGFSLERPESKISYREGPSRDFRLRRRRVIWFRLAEASFLGVIIGVCLIGLGIFAMVGYTLFVGDPGVGEGDSTVEWVFAAGLLGALFAIAIRFFNFVPAHVEMSRDDSSLLFVDMQKGTSSIDISEVRDVVVRSILGKQQRRMGKLEFVGNELEEWTPPNGRPVLTLLTHDAREIGILTLNDGGTAVSREDADAVVAWLKEELELNTSSPT